jgi:uncharacterized integral membrane protein
VNAFSALVLLLLLVFILQNGGPVQISFFALEAVLPHRGGAVVGGDRRGVARGDPGQLRIMQLRRAADGSTGRDDGAVGAVSAGTVPGACHRLQSIPVDECRTGRTQSGAPQTGIPRDPAGRGHQIQRRTRAR